MFPKEHGAYGQLLFPIATALAIGRPGVAAVALGAAAICAFFAHEPLLVLLGQRGARATRELGRTATMWFGLFASLALACAVWSIAAAPPSARLALVPTVALGVVLAFCIFTGREHTLAGEVVSALALSSIAYPIGVASAASARASLSCAVAFAAAFAIGVVCVHGVIGFTRNPPARRARAIGAAAAIGGLAIVYALAAQRVLEIVTPLAVGPASIAGLALTIKPPSARKLRVVGWTLVVTSVLTAAVLIAAFR